MLEESQRCQMCGTSAWEWDPRQGGSVYAYEAMPSLCQGCLRRDAARDDESFKGDGVRITLVPASKARKLRTTPARAPGRSG